MRKILMWHTLVRPCEFLIGCEIIHMTFNKDFCLVINEKISALISSKKCKKNLIYMPQWKTFLNKNFLR